MNRKLPWAEIWLLSIMAQYFKLRILYTPVIPYLEAFENGNNKSFLRYLRPIRNNYRQNHIYYLKEEQVEKNLIYDERGGAIITDYVDYIAKRSRVSGIFSNLTFMELRSTTCYCNSHCCSQLVTWQVTPYHFIVLLTS